MSKVDEKSKSKEKDEYIDTFLLMFPEYRNLLKEVASLKFSIQEKQEVKYFDTSRLLRKLKNYQTLLDEEIMEGKMHSSFLNLDKYNKIQVLKNMILCLIDELIEDGLTSNSPEVRAYYFLYMITRFVESEKRFPRQPELHDLLNTNTKILPSIEKLLKLACSDSPQVKSDISKQRKEKLHNTVGVGIDKNDEN